MRAVGGGFVPLLLGDKGQNGGDIAWREGQDGAQQQTDLGQAQAQRGGGGEQMGQDSGCLQTRGGREQQGRARGREQSCWRPPLSGADAVASAPGSGGPG